MRSTRRVLLAAAAVALIASGATSSAGAQTPQQGSASRSGYPLEMGHSCRDMAHG